MSTLGAYFRLVRAGWILAREGVFAALPGDQLTGAPRMAWRTAKLLARRKVKNRERSQRMSLAVDRLGPSYVKLGQFLATRPDVVGADVAMDLANLQDRMKTFPTAEAVAEIEESLGRPITELFRHFDAPIAAASIAQVHPAAVLRDGSETKVAVKVIRPGVRRRFFNDLESYFLAARMQERFMPSSRRLKPVEVTQTLAQTTKIEMDLRLEAAALSELGENTRDDPGFRVPWVDWERTGRDVVTMEWIDGVKMNDIEGLFKQKEWWKQTAVVCSLWCCIYTVGEVALGLGLCFAPCLCTAYYTQIRDGVKHKYGLPNDEFCGSYTYTTYLPYICGSCCCCLPICPNCNSCAAYQMAYFMKYNAPVKKEFKSPCYTLICSICSPKA